MGELFHFNKNRPELLSELHPLIEFHSMDNTITDVDLRERGTNFFELVGTATELKSQAMLTGLALVTTRDSLACVLGLRASMSSKWPPTCVSAYAWHFLTPFFASPPAPMHSPDKPLCEAKATS
ncbi:MAG: hypothetical protein AAF483_01230 [Planctomycetota bacterium]